MRIKSKRINPVSSREEFCQTVDQIARLDIDAQKAAVALKKRHQELDDKYGPAIEAARAQIYDLYDRARPYFLDHAAELCNPGLKEGETKLARFGIRMGMPTVVKKVRTALKTLAAAFAEDNMLRRFIRAVPEMDKDAILAAFRDPARSGEQAALTSHGITVEQTEDFWCKSKAEEQV